MSFIDTVSSNGAGIIISDEEGNVLLVRGSGGGKWSFPKGQSESHDTDHLSTAIREVYEETGLRFNRDYDLLSDSSFTCFDRTYFFAIMRRGSEQNIRIHPKEISDYRWMNPRKSCHYWAELNTGVRAFIKREQQC